MELLLRTLAVRQPATVRTLADTLGRRQQNVRALLDRMAELGWVQREPVALGRRNPRFQWRIALVEDEDGLDRQPDRPLET
jgi:DNA-binding MarR family transcriptional regulator